jgi:uncharacterized protein (DUF885 family)
VSDFDALIDEYLADYYEQSPVAATMQGWPGLDDRLPDLSGSGYAAREAADDRWFDRFSALDAGSLDFAEQIDRELVLSHLRGSRIMREWAVWRRQADPYLNAGLMGVFGLFLRRPLPEPELVAAAAARLDGVPALLDAARENLDPDLAHPLLTQRAVGQCRAGITYSRHLLPAEVENPDSRALLAAAGERAAAAYEAFVPDLERLATEARGDFAIGEARYSALLREKEGLPFDARGLRHRGQAEYDRLDAEMRDLAQVVGGHSDWRAVIGELNTDAPDTPEAMRDEYEKWTERARRFLADNGLVTLPEGEACEVLPSPPFQRPVLAVASYFGPPAFKPSLVGRFNVPYPPDGTPDDEVRKRLMDNSRPSIPTTSVHEAYPGHHWHYAMMQSRARPLRLTLSTPYFTEGWALYAERMMREEGFFTDPGQELSHLDARIFRAARIVVDVSLHVGEMTIDEAITFMSTKASLTEPTARAEVLRYCGWPTQAASYLTGSLEIERMRTGFLDGGRGDLRDFHDRLAASGSLPLALAERALLGS